MSLNNYSVLSNVLIDGNSVTSGLDSSGTSYYYDTCASINADATVVNNTFSGIKSASGIFGVDMISLYGCSTKFSNNTFIRGAQGVRSYINDVSTFLSLTPSDHIITENIFDLFTTDGTDELLIKNVTAGTNYERNKNQTDYIAIQLSKYNVTSLSDPLVGTAGMLTTINAYPQTFLAQTIYEQITINSLATAISNAKVTFDIDLGEMIPVGTQIINATIGFTFIGGTPDLETGGSVTSQFGFTLYDSVVQKYDLSSLPLSYIDVHTNALIFNNYGGINLGTSNIISVNSPAALSAILGHSNYLTLDLTSSPSHQTQYNKLFAQVQFNLSIASSLPSSQKSVFMLVSPFAVRYRY